MKRTSRILGTQAMALTLWASSAWAIPADSADDICAPTDAPCIISQIYNVSGHLDFGLRTVRIQGFGRLLGEPDVSLSAGKLEVDVGNEIAINSDGGNGGGVYINVRRACSGDGTTPCYNDAECATLSLGTCSAGNTGTVHVDSRISGAGVDPGGGSITAAGDITLLQRVTFAGLAAGVYGSTVEIESTMGSVTVDHVNARSGAGNSYYDGVGEGGYITIRAALDVIITGTVDSWGAGGGGETDIEAGRDVILRSSVASNAGNGLYANGGHVTLEAGRDIHLMPGAGGDQFQQVDTDGGGGFYFYGYGGAGSLASGYGGYQYLIAGEDISLAQTGRLHSNGGSGAAGGWITVISEGMTTIDGIVRAIGPAPLQSGDGGAAGGNVSFYCDGGMSLGPTGFLDTASAVNGGAITLDVNGPVELLGDVDVRGTGTGIYSYPQGGFFELTGLADVTFGGRIRAGSRDDGYRLEIDVCRLELISGGVIDHTLGEPNPRNEGNRIVVRESMRAEAGSKLLADQVGGHNTIIYRDPYKPPALEGLVRPPAILQTNPSLVGCPVCGNLEIDQGESCDDGNTTSGDGCRADCQDEGCIADTPGFPTAALCNDGDGCTLDRCDPVAHACTNVVSCEEGVQCTVDTCVSGGCQHTADDSLCDDDNECTDDLCNATTGCVHADLTGGACEDGDFCTVTGTCDDGDCAATDASLAQDNRVRIGLPAGPANDRMKVSLNIPSSEVTSAPTVSGVKVVVVDAADQTLYEAELAAAQWVDTNGSGLSFRFRDTQGTAGPANGISSATIKHIPSRGVARAKLKMKGSEVPGAAGQGFLSVSLLFGLDPASDDCVSARLVPCTPKATSVSCRDL